MSDIEEVTIQKWADGAGVQAWMLKGQIVPTIIPDPVKRLQYIADFQYKDGDVMICSYPKCGLHWLSEMLTRSLREDADTVCHFLPLFEFISAPEMIEQAPEPRVLATHYVSTFLPKEHVENKGKIILLMRNPKDVAVSFFNFTKNLKGIKSQVPWEHFLDFFMKGEVFYNDYFDYIHDFERMMAEHSGNILPVFYEDLKNDCVNQLKKMMDFLGLARSEDLLKNVAKNCQFNTMQADKEAHPAFKEFLTDKGKLIVYRKGEVGDWKNWFTVIQDERMDELITEKMKGSKFNFRYS